MARSLTQITRISTLSVFAINAREIRLFLRQFFQLLEKWFDNLQHFKIKSTKAFNIIDRIRIGFCAVNELMCVKRSASFDFD